MRSAIFVGIASGLASAMLTVALDSGSPFAVALFFFAQLPIFIAATGWNHRVGLIGAIVATLAIAAFMGFAGGRGYALSVGLPAWWLGYLALLARPLDERGAVQWYPVGRLVLWAAALGAALVITSIPLIAGSLEEYRATLSKAFETFLRRETGTPEDQPLTLPGGDAAQVVTLFVQILPPFGAAVWMLTTLINLWLAARIVRASGRLTRPWPEIAAMTFPRLTPLVFAAAIAASLLPGLAGFAAEIGSAVLLTAFGLLGLAVVHVGTQGVGARPLILAAVYFFLLVQTWTVLLLALLGMADHALKLRGRMIARRGPPPPATLP